MRAVYILDKLTDISGPDLREAIFKSGLKPTQIQLVEPDKLKTLYMWLDCTTNAPNFGSD